MIHGADIHRVALQTCVSGQYLTKSWTMFDCTHARARECADAPGRAQRVNETAALHRTSYGNPLIRSLGDYLGDHFAPEYSRRRCPLEPLRSFSAERCAKGHSLCAAERSEALRNLREMQQRESLHWNNLNVPHNTKREALCFLRAIIIIIVKHQFFSLLSNIFYQLHIKIFKYI